MNIYELINRIQLTETSSGAGNAATNAAEGQPQTIMEVIFDSWYIMLPLGIMSFLAVYIFVERFLSIRKSLQEERDFMLKVKSFVEDGKFDAAKQVCASTDLRDIWCTRSSLVRHLHVPKAACSESIRK